VDIRAIVCGALAAICLIGATALSATGSDGYVEMMALAGTLSGYVVGLYSSPQGGDDA